MYILCARRPPISSFPLGTNKPIKNINIKILQQHQQQTLIKWFFLIDRIRILLYTIMTVDSLLSTNGSRVDGFNWSGSLVAQLGLLILCSVLGTLANALVFAVFYRRPSLRTISNRLEEKIMYSVTLAWTEREAHCPAAGPLLPTHRDIQCLKKRWTIFFFFASVNIWSHGLFAYI